MIRLTDVVKHLLIINVLMAIVTWWLFPDWNNKLALYYPQSAHFHPMQVVTHFFMHGGYMHLFFNMYALAMFGPPIEALYRPKRFLFYYLFCALGAAGLHTLYNWYTFSHLQEAMAAFQASPSYDSFWAFFDQVRLKQLTSKAQSVVEAASAALVEGQTHVAEPVVKLMQQIVTEKMDIPAVGASGAIYGLLLAFGMQFPNAELMLIFLPIPIKAKYFIPLLMAAEFYFGIQNLAWDPVAHFAHLGGALSGLILILYWRKSGQRLY